MKELDISLCAIFLSAGTYYAIKVLSNNGLTDFLRPAHYYALIILIFSGIISWFATVWMLNPNEFKVNNKQKLSLVASIIISILLWARYAFTISENITK